MKPLEGKVALVAGATRGAGRGIAIALGELGATVWCSGRSTRDRPMRKERRETIEETAELVTAAGGRGLWVRTDHSVEAEVVATCERIEKETGGLDILVDDIWGADDLIEFGRPFWELDPDRGRLMFERGLFTHFVTVRHAVPLLLKRGRGLVVEVTDGDTFGYRGMFHYDLLKMSVIRMAWNMSRDLRDTNVTALAVTPGFLRSEEMLERFGVTEANWREGAKVEKHFIASETPLYVGRAVASLAADPKVHEKAGRVFSSWQLAKEYGFTDADGSRPDWGAYFEKAFGRMYPVADDAAYEAWRDGPGELADY